MLVIHLIRLQEVVSATAMSLLSFAGVLLCAAIKSGYGDEGGKLCDRMTVHATTAAG